MTTGCTHFHLHRHGSVTLSIAAIIGCHGGADGSTYGGPDNRAVAVAQFITDCRTNRAAHRTPDHGFGSVFTSPDSLRRQQQHRRNHIHY
jgi:hypothetical protein